MLNYKHVLLATDLSTQSHLIAERAHDIAQNSNAKLSIIHVLEHSPVAYGGEFSIPIDLNLEQSLESHAREALNKLGSEFNVDGNNLHLESGSVQVAAVDLAEETNVDLIVVGTHGHHGIDLLLGSRANAILHHAKCDVMVIRIKED